MSKSMPDELPALDLGRCALFLDYDGTLVPIAPTPDAAHADDALRHLLERLARRLDGAIAIVSGRPVADIDGFLAPLRFSVAGLHGLQLRPRSGDLLEHVPPDSVLAAARLRLGAFVELNPGTLLEDKRLSVALHFRQAPDAAAAAEAVASRLADESAGLLRLQRGKMVVELLPAGRDKGRAIDDLLQLPDFAGRRPVFVGDDVTDEAGFRTVNHLDGTSIRVGHAEGGTDAQHYLADIGALQRWLERSLTGEQS
ncbi:MAG: trehalose-phosphatase [Geminicoccaceae bacterium]